MTENPTVETESSTTIDKALFWAKFETLDSKTGYMPSEVTIDDKDCLTLSCPRPVSNSFMRLFAPKPIQEGSLVSIAYEDQNTFELWSGEIANYLGTNSKGLDEYEISSVKQEMISSERKHKRFLTSIPVRLENTRSKLNKVYLFSGCEISEGGIGLWFPNSLKNKIRLEDEYTLTFEPKEVEPFAFNIKCVRPNSEDTFSRGFSAGFTFFQNDPNSLSFIRLGQLIEAKGQLIVPNLSAPGHYLSRFWIGESLKELN